MQNENDGGLDRFRLDKSQRETSCIRTQPPRPEGLFLKGPIPWDWLSLAAGLPGHALHVALALWFRAGIERSVRVRLTRKVLSMLGVSRFSGYRGLKALEEAKLVEVERHVGRCPLATIKEIKVETEE